MFWLLLLPIVSHGALIYTKGYRDTLAQVRKNPHHLASLIVTTTLTDCEKCEAALEIYEQFSHKVEKVVNTYVLDCKQLQHDSEERSIIPSCEVANVDQLPAITFLSPPKKEVFTTPKSYMPVENTFRGSLSVASLIDGVQKFAPIYSVIVNDPETFETVFLKDRTIPNKVLLAKPDEVIPLWWRGVSAKFRLRLEFAEVDSDEPYIYKPYRVPRNKVSVVVLVWDPVDKKYHHEVFQGNLNYDDLEEFLEKFALQNIKQKDQSVYEEDPLKWKQVDQIQIPHLKSILDIQEQWVALHIRVGKDPHPSFKGFKKNFTGLVKIFEVKCQNETEYDTVLKTLKLKTREGLLIFPFVQKSLKNYIIVRERGTHLHIWEDSFAEISEFMFDSITRTSTIYHVNYNNLLDELQFARQQDLFPVYWLYESRNFFWKTVALTFSSQSKYKRHLKFLFTRDPQKEIVDQWEIKTYPRIMTFATVNVDTGNHQKYDWEGAQTVTNLISYLNQVAQENEQSKIKNKPVDMVQNQEDFEQLCYMVDKPCVIALLDTVKTGKFNRDVEMLHQLRTHFKDRDLSWIWIDGRCNKELLPQFKTNANNLSQFIVLFPQKSKYIKFEEEPSLTTLVKFVDVATSKGKKKYHLIDDYLELRNRNCAELRESLIKEYHQEKEKRQALFAQAERQRDLENAKIERIKEQKRILEVDDWDKDDDL